MKHKNYFFWTLVSLIFVCSTASANGRCPLGQGERNGASVYYPSAASKWKGYVCFNWAYDESKAEGYLNRVEIQGRGMCSQVSELESGERVIWRGNFPTVLWAAVYNFKCKDPNLMAKPEPQTSTDNPSNPENQIKRSLDEAKVTCSDLGFTSGTEAFGKCVLQLTK